MTDYRLISLTPDDWQRYRAIRLEMLADSPQAFGSRYADNLERPEAFWRGRLETAQQGESTWLLFAEVDGVIVGMAGAHCESEETPPGVVDIVSVFVTPRMRGTGIAGALMEAILDQVRRTGRFHTARLGVNAGQARALALYRRFGFRLVEELERVLGDGKKHLHYVMDKDL